MTPALKGTRGSQADLAQARELEFELVSIFRAWFDAGDAGGKA